MKTNSRKKKKEKNTCLFHPFPVSGPYFTLESSFFTLSAFASYLKKNEKKRSINKITRRFARKILLQKKKKNKEINRNKLTDPEANFLFPKSIFEFPKLDEPFKMFFFI